MTDADLARIDTLLAAAREVEGCSDHGCLLRVHPRGGMGTNGGCHCVGRNSEDGWLRVRAERLDLVRLLTLARQTPALVAEVRRLRAMVTQLAPPDVTPLTAVQRRNLAAMMARDEDPGAPCEDRPDAGPTRMEIVETEALARVVGNTAAVNAARRDARVWRRYDRERDRVRELSAVLELVRDALGCETWVECPERVLGLRAKVEQVNRVLTGERDVGDALLEQRDEALAEVERLRSIVGGRTEPPSAAEMAKHGDDGGSWLVTLPARKQVRFAPETRYVSEPAEVSRLWWCEGALWVPVIDGRPCAWPVVPSP